jgi:hypothetical protein
MPLVVTSDSHTDHGLSEEIMKFLVERFADRSAFFIEEVELPEHLGEVPCNLVGPVTGCEPVIEMDVHYKVRGNRKWTSRLLKSAEGMRVMSRKVTVIAGPHGPYSCVLYTAYGGPCAPREPGDPAINSWDQLLWSREFWTQHALIE